MIGFIVLAAIIWAVAAMSSQRGPNPASQLQPKPGSRNPVAERLAEL